MRTGGIKLASYFSLPLQCAMKQGETYLCKNNSFAVTGGNNTRPTLQTTKMTFREINQQSMQRVKN
jgi:hypothetical protein